MAKAHSLPVLGRIPIDPAIANACDQGMVESLPDNPLFDVGRKLDQMLEILEKAKAVNPG